MLSVPARRCVESALARREGFPVFAGHLDLALEWQHALTLRAHVDDLDGVVDSWCFHSRDSVFRHSGSGCGVQRVEAMCSRMSATSLSNHSRRFSPL